MRWLWGATLAPKSPAGERQNLGTLPVEQPSAAEPKWCRRLFGLNRAMPQKQ